MIPVLAVEDPVSAREMLARVFGFVPSGNGHMVLGAQPVAVIRAGEEPGEMIRLPLDHVAFATPDPDATCAAYKARGAQLAEAFTPDGPRDIPEFWDNGVRFVFFNGPEGWPLEFCTRKSTPPRTGHDHRSIRTADIEAVEERLAALGAEPVARHSLSAAAGPVDVRFLALGPHMFEVFDEGPFADPGHARGWIGLLST